MGGADGSELTGARGERWSPVRLLRSIEEAAAFVDDVGFALLFPADRPIAPSLWEAVAGPDATPFAAGMGSAESLVWDWKDQLPEAGFAWSGRFLHGRASLLSPRLLAALYSGHGEPDDDRAFPPPPEAHEIAEALRAGPLPSSALRRHHDRSDPGGTGAGLPVANGCRPCCARRSRRNRPGRANTRRLPRLRTAKNTAGPGRTPRPAGMT